MHALGRLEQLAAERVPGLVIGDDAPLVVVQRRRRLDARDDALVILNCGDEMTVKFAENALPEKTPGMVRDYFLFTSGWDKDGDYHVEAGLTVEPIPWHGMDDQRYGHQTRPQLPNDAWMSKYNTRWVGPMTLTGKSELRSKK